ncbi:MAG: MFS transporter [Alphaproteobacteria bacterium]
MAQGETGSLAARAREAQARLPGLAQAALTGARAYADWRIVTIFFLGVSSGLPLALTLGTLSIWLSREGVDKTTIGLFGAVTLPYALKFLWAPVIDRLGLPLLGRLFGRRRSWALVTQAALMAAIAAMALTNPAIDPLLLAVFALLTAFFSASQDIVIDAYRVEILEPRQYGAGAATIVFGYRVGMLVSGAGALYLADLVPWRAVYLVMAGCVLIGVVTVLASREPRVPEAALQAAGSLGRALKEAVVAPLLDFMKRQLWLVVLLFVLFYKFGDALAGIMTGPFLVELQFSNAEIANVSKLYGFIATLVGLALGGMMIARLGTLGSLWIAGGAQLVSNLLFVLQAHVGHDVGVLALVIGVENFSGGIGTAALVAYLSGLCNLLYTATQYALLSAIASVARTVLATPAGWLAEVMGWMPFFALTAVAALPGLALLYWLGRKGAVGAPAASTAAKAE